MIVIQYLNTNEIKNNTHQLVLIISMNKSQHKDNSKSTRWRLTFSIYIYQQGIYHRDNANYTNLQSQHHNQLIHKSQIIGTTTTRIGHG